MSRIEEIVIEAYELGLKDQIFEEVSKMKFQEKYRYIPLDDVYEKALKKIKEECLTN
jgi:hypothetical protein